jgi:hypothetical protein
VKRTLSLSAVALASFLIAPTMYGQASHLRLRFQVPFSFSANNQTFTPGEYEFTQQSLLVFKVANLKRNDSAFESVLPAQSHQESNGQVKLVFHRYGNQYFLAAMSFGSWESTYDFKTSTDEKRLGQTSARKPMMTVSTDPEGTVLVAAGGQN